MRVRSLIEGGRVVDLPPLVAHAQLADGRATRVIDEIENAPPPPPEALKEKNDPPVKNNYGRKHKGGNR